MGKRRQVETALESWPSVDATLRQLCLWQSEETGLEAEMNEQLTAVRARYEIRLSEIAEQRKAQAALIEQFCVDHRAEFDARKSRELTHGTVNFRTSPPSVRLVGRKWTWPSVLETLLKRLQQFVRTKQEVNKDEILRAHAAGEITDERLADVGLKVSQDETFGYDLKLDSIAEELKRRVVAA